MSETNLLQKIANILGLLVVLGAVSGLILSLTIQPELLHIFSILAYIVLFFTIVYLVILKANGISQFWRWIILVLFYLGTIPFFIWVGSWYQISKNSSKEAVVFPFQPNNEGFEEVDDETDITPWFTVPESKLYEAIISQDFAHTGKQSLRLFVDMQSAATSPETEYAGIGLKEGIPPHTKAIVTWVYIPQSEPIQNVVFKAHLLSYSKNDFGITNVFMGEDIRVKPGTWTPLFIGTFGETDSASEPLTWNGKIDELYLSIWSDQPYSGSIFIDDFSIYN